MCIKIAREDVMTWKRLRIIGILPHASGHSSGNRQGHVTKTKTYRFEIFVAFNFTNV